MLKILKSNQLNSKLRNLDWLLIFIVLLIGTISLLTIYSIDTGQNNYFEKHTIRFLFSFILLIAVALTSIKFWVGSAYLFYIFVLILLILVDYFGLSAQGAKRWLNLGVFNLQPSELMKVAVILALARYYQFIKTDIAPNEKILKFNPANHSIASETANINNAVPRSGCFTTTINGIIINASGNASFVILSVSSIFIN